MIVSILSVHLMVTGFALSIPKRLVMNTVAPIIRSIALKTLELGLLLILLSHYLDTYKMSSDVLFAQVRQTLQDEVKKELRTEFEAEKALEIKQLNDQHNTQMADMKVTVSVYQDEIN